MGNVDKEVKKYRHQIDKIDRVILEKLADRFFVAAKIGRVKAVSGQAIDDGEREKELMALHRQYAKELNLEWDFVKCLFGLIIKQAKRAQRKII